MNSAYDTTTELEDPDGGGGGGDSVEDVFSGLRMAERLFFESGETMLVAMDPYADFKRSMEEMVEANGLKEEELTG
ncbi:hypothetical protein C3L33_09604, partial [Rhododendron williamsianum]